MVRNFPVCGLRLLSLLLAAFFPAGCSDIRPERDDAGRVIVRYMVWGRPNEVNALKAALSEHFAPSNPDIHVELVWVSGGTYQAKLATMLAADMAPDLFMVHNAFFPTLVKNRLAYPLDELVAADPEVDLEQFFPEVVEACRYRGSLWNLPVSFYTVMLYYNRDLFDKAGLDYPSVDWTWEDMLEAAKRLTIRDESNRPRQYGLKGPTEWLDYLFLVWQAGGRVFDDEGNLVMGRPENIDAATEAWQFIADLANRYEVVPSAAADESLPANPFLAGKVAMQISGTWMNNQIMATWESARETGEPMIRWGLAPVPRHHSRATLFGGGSPVMYRNTRHPEETWRVMKFFLSDVWQRHLAVDGRSVPAKVSIARSKAFLAMEGIPEHVDMWQILDALAYARTQPRGLYVAEIMEQQIAELRDNIVGGRTADIRNATIQLQRSFDDPNPYAAMFR